MALMNVGGDIVDVPDHDDPSKMWFQQPRHSGSMPHLDKLDRLAWTTYRRIPPLTIKEKCIKFYQDFLAYDSAGRRLWRSRLLFDRPRLTFWWTKLYQMGIYI